MNPAISSVSLDDLKKIAEAQVASLLILTRIKAPEAAQPYLAAAISLAAMTLDNVTAQYEAITGQSFDLTYIEDAFKQKEDNV
jgi:hypothetical protein